MKKVDLLIALIGSFIFFSCNQQTATHSTGMNGHMGDSGSMMEGNGQQKMKQIMPHYTNLNAGVSNYMHQLAEDYLSIEDALVLGKETDAATAARGMMSHMNGFEKEGMTDEQRKTYESVEPSLKEQADQISKSGLDHQRHYFSMMSEGMDSMVKSFGAGMTLYHMFCPMYNDSQGAVWLSNNSEVRNPYFGEKMMTCGTAEEMIH